jgi:hypothetical protein
MRWPERHYLVSETHGFLYAPIAKVACSALKAWMIELEEDSGTAARVDSHEYARDHYELQCHPATDARRFLRDTNLFQFAFVRNPWDRLVSAFLNKFVPVRNGALKLPARQFLRDVERRRRVRRFTDIVTAGWLGSSKPASPLNETADAFTFRHFVAELTQCNPRKFDLHWRPQSMFLGNLRLDFVGRFEHLDRDFRTLCQRLNLASELPLRNKTERGCATVDCLADWPLAELRGLPAFPGYSQFYTPDLAAQVATIYAEDVRRFGYEFAPAAAAATGVAA